ncbi:RpiB/LacA/LacB family sugar-phosphate isomerase [Butyrivibrio sp. JL13D10]|uniref:RpiB/LacA/LacB family sugar-phosphate isomerase n=1 Tax=Butyrivibrio sp. JL13D10 TaxID=3236815 RepID=UPI0038B56017
MKIAVIQATSQINKNGLLLDAVKKYAKESEVINFGCTDSDRDSYSYIEISVLIGLLLASKAVDFVVTGCSSGQGMMLACNNMPGVLCGYAPTPKDAFLFAQINNGNAISLPLGEEYTWSGEDNLYKTIESLFSEPFGQGYPKSESKRKQKDTALLKDMRRKSQVDIGILLEKMDAEIIHKVLRKNDVIGFILSEGKNKELKDFLRQKSGN